LSNRFYNFPSKSILIFNQTMKFPSSTLSIVVILSTAMSCCYAFHGSLQQQRSMQSMRPTQQHDLSSAALFLTPQDLTDYMAKANEAKVQAMKQIEDKKNAEIQVRMHWWLSLDGEMEIFTMPRVCVFECE
jgi:hypothetical protein